ncbi:hypothetical protein EDC65_2543 [Stella humosa]|uniref:DUF4148 domain-containing protein n=1 Tax=Stella humosa TaxID=94 RepID=A0A3N1LGR1_9PROT|nr:hypothetical protein [Stella humosa]ROP90687.1 hypothetical protein EDC65_2543 [Stella humosa]BBK29413.1 hypothetical protein STHU_00470 [Stella humosa]
MRSVFAAILLSAVALPAFAQSGTPGIDRRQAIQSQRIEQGYRSGTLSAQEAWKLDQGQRRVNRVERRAKADGYVSRGERQRIRDMQNRQGQRINREKRDWNGY